MKIQDLNFSVMWEWQFHLSWDRICRSFADFPDDLQKCDFSINENKLQLKNNLLKIKIYSVY